MTALPDSTRETLTREERATDEFMRPECWFADHMNRVQSSPDAFACQNDRHDCEVALEDHAPKVQSGIGSAIGALNAMHEKTGERGFLDAANTLMDTLTELQAPMRAVQQRIDADEERKHPEVRR